MSDRNADNAGMVLSNAVADAVEQAGKFTVMVNARRRLPLSGILVAQDLILTASHGVERETEIQIGLPDGSEATASLAGRDRGTDLAVLRLQSPTQLAAGQPSKSEVRVGHLVVAVGRPSPEGVQASFGMLTALGSGLRTPQGGVLEHYLLTDAIPYPGFSGGPLVDLSGGLLGLNTSGLARGTSLVLPAQAAWEAAQYLAEHGRIKRGYLGIRSQVVEIPAQARSALNREQSSGLLIVGVEAEGPAGQSPNGLMVGDILVGLNGQPVSDHESLMARLSGDVAGKVTEVQVLRGGQLQTVQVSIGERQ